MPNTDMEVHLHEASDPNDSKKKNQKKKIRKSARGLKGMVYNPRNRRSLVLNNGRDEYLSW